MIFHLFVLVSAVRGYTCPDDTVCVGACCSNDGIFYYCCAEAVQGYYTGYNFSCKLSQQLYEPLMQGFFLNIESKINTVEFLNCISRNDMRQAQLYLCGAYRDLKNGLENIDRIPWGLYSAAKFYEKIANNLAICSSEYAVISVLLNDGINTLKEQDYSFVLDPTSRVFSILGENFYYNIYDQFIPSWESGSFALAGFHISVLLYEISSFYNVTAIFELHGQKIYPYAYISQNSVIPSFVNGMSYYTPRGEYLEFCKSMDISSSIMVIRGFMSWVNFKYSYLPYESCVTEENKNEIAEMFCYSAAFLKYAEEVNRINGIGGELEFGLGMSYISAISEKILGILTNCLQLFGDSPPNLLLVSFQNGVRNLYLGEQQYIDLKNQVFVIDGGYNIYRVIYGSHGLVQDVFESDFFRIGSNAAFLVHSAINWSEVKFTYDPQNNIRAQNFNTQVPYYGKKAESSTISSYADTIIMLDNIISYSQYSYEEQYDLDLNFGDDL